MDPQDSQSIPKAKSLEEEARKALKEKEYDEAISKLSLAKDIYTRLGLSQEVGILIRDIARIKNLKKNSSQKADTEKIPQFRIDLHAKEDSKDNEMITEEKGYELLETAQNQVLADNLDEGIYFYDVAYKVFKKLNKDYECKQILWQINELKEYQRHADSLSVKGVKPEIKDIVSLSKAEQRRLKIKAELDGRKKLSEKDEKQIKVSSEKVEERKLPKIFEQMRKTEIEEQRFKERTKTLIEIQQEQRKQELYEREKRVQLLKEQKKKEEAQLAQAQDLLAKGKQMLDKKDYEEAKRYYSESAELFSQLGWTNQVSILQNELRNIDRYKKEDQMKQQQVLLSKVESDRQFQQSVSKALSEKNRKDQTEREKFGALPIEIQTTLEKVELLKSKAEKEETTHNFSRALARYEYIKTLYQSISKEIMDLTEEISNIEVKIAELKAKL
jgi:hypothetical protein